MSTVAFWAHARARERAALTGVETASYRQCRRVKSEIDALEHHESLQPEEPDEAVERMEARPGHEYEP